MKFHNPSMQGSKDMACTKKLDERTNRGMDKQRQNNMPHQFHSKLGALSGHLLIATNLSSFKALASIVFEIFC